MTNFLKRYRNGWGIWRSFYYAYGVTPSQALKALLSYIMVLAGIVACLWVIADTAYGYVSDRQGVVSERGEK